jgi:RNA polymerase sigma-70 factor (ECF subfamily)
MGRPMSESIDTQIQACVDTGAHRRALELLAHAYLDPVFRYCFRVLNGDMTRARDVTQQVFEEVCKGIGKFRGEAAIRTWLLAIAHNQCLKEIDTQQRHRAILHEHQGNIATRVHTDPPLGSESVMLSKEGLTQLQGALDQLDPEARSILIMRFGVGMSHELSAAEIAKALGWSRAVAYRKLQEALARLRRIMHDDGA